MQVPSKSKHHLAVGYIIENTSDISSFYAKWKYFLLSLMLWMKILFKFLKNDHAFVNQIKPDLSTNIIFLIHIVTIENVCTSMGTSWIFIKYKDI